MIRTDQVITETVDSETGSSRAQPPDGGVRA